MNGSVVIAAEPTSAPQREERSDEALSGSGPASDAVDRMHAAGKWPDLFAAVADAGAEAVSDMAGGPRLAKVIEAERRT